MLLNVLGLSLLNIVYNLLYITGLNYFDVSTGAFTLSMTVVVLLVILLTLREKIEIAALLEAVIITPAVAINYPDVNAIAFAFSVVLNTAIFPICFGIPIIILLKEEMKYKFVF